MLNSPDRFVFRLLNRGHRLTVFFGLYSALACPALAESDTKTLTVTPGQWIDSVVESFDPASESFVVEVRIDPVTTEGGDLQVVAGLAIGLENTAAAVPTASLRLELREGSGRARFDLWHRGDPLTVREPRPKPPGWWGPLPEYQCPNELPNLVPKL